MTATPAGAAPHVEWHDIDWRAVHENVRRLQSRIVKATKAGRWGKVKALQRLLTHSFDGKAMAVRRVTENQGKRTPGVDRVVWETPKKKTQAVQALRKRGYRPRALRRVYIPKSNGQKRPLGIPTMHDRAMQALYLLALEPISETTADPNSYGFRKERGVADAIEQCYIVFGRSVAPDWILEGDIKSCFDEISHDWLLQHVPMDKTVLAGWLKAGYMEQSSFYPTEAGTPQGGVISPVLANFALDGLEKRLRKLYPRNGSRARKLKVNVVRYADDFIISGVSKEFLEDEIKPEVQVFLAERGLQLSPEKTVITHIDVGFDFLGHNIRKYDGKLLTKPSYPRVLEFIRKLRKVFRRYDGHKAAHLIAALNPIVRGWCGFYRHAVSSRTFSYVSHELFNCVCRWIRRNHPNKNWGWCKRRYFGRVGNNNWAFQDEFVKGMDKFYLFDPKTVHIRRHVKVKGEANPFDPEWETYFERRFGVKMAANLKGKRQLIGLWKEQDGICPVCHQKITELTGWHSHHLRMRFLGGSDASENLVLLHPTCHNQVHAKNLIVSKPRPSKGVRKA